MKRRDNMKGRILVSLIMVTMALLILSIGPADKPHAQSKKSKTIVRPEDQVDLSQFDTSELEDVGIVDLAPRSRRIKPAAAGNVVYVGDNISTGAGVRVFIRNTDGSLTDAPGSPFA